MALFGAVAILAFSPLGWCAWHYWDAYTGQASFTWIGAQIDRAGSIQPLFDNLRSAMGLFNFRGNGDDFFVEEPLLDIPVSILFTVGLIYSLFLVAPARPLSATSYFGLHARCRYRQRTKWKSNFRSRSTRYNLCRHLPGLVVALARHGIS